MKQFIGLSFIICHLAFCPAGAQTYTLEQLKDSALQHNITIRTARYNIDAAAEQRKEAFTKYFPNVSGTGLWFNANKPLVSTDLNPAEVLPAELSGSLAQMFPAEALAALSSPVSIGMLKNGALAGLTALQPVFAGGQIVNGNRLAQVGGDVARLQLQLAENEVEKQTEQYFWQLASLQEKLRTIDAADSLLADIAKDVAVAVRAGVALRNDLLQVQLRQNDMESQRLKVENGISIVRLLLGQYCGLSNSQFTIDNSQLAALKETHADHCELASLPEYQLLEKQVEAATLQKKLAIGQNLPTVAVGAGYSYNNLMDKDQYRAMVFATVSVPISDWWGGSHAIRRRKIAQQQAVEQLYDNAELLQIRMQNAWNSVVEARAQTDLARRGIEQSAENLRLHRDYYRAGTCTMVDLLEAQLLYQQACDKQTDATAALNIRLLEYRQSVGVGNGSF